jgi:hypothetical protein
MKHIELMKTEYLTIEYNAVDDYITANWTGPQTDASIKNGYDNISFFLKKEMCHKLLDNHRQVQGLWDDLANWFAYNWHPRAEASGLTYHACVYSADTFSRLSTDKAIHMVKDGIVEGFETVSEAEGWLMSM